MSTFDANMIELLCLIIFVLGVVALAGLLS
jgi:hypothetical protein